MFYIDYKSGIPLYEQLYRSVVAKAASGILKAGEALPSVRTLAQELGVNPNTVQKAFALLERDEVIYSLPGKGSFVADTAGAVRQKQLQALKSLQAAVREALESGLTKQELIATIEEEDTND